MTEKKDNNNNNIEDTKTIKPKEEFWCRICGRIGFSNSKALAGHIGAHSRSTPNTNKTKQRPKKKQRLKLTLKKKKEKKTKDIKRERSNYSKPTTVKLPSFKNMKQRKTSRKDYHCNYCNKQCESIQGLRAHERGIECKRNKQNTRKRKRKEMESKNHNKRSNIYDGPSNKKMKIKQEKVLSNCFVHALYP